MFQIKMMKTALAVGDTVETQEGRSIMMQDDYYTRMGFYGEDAGSPSWLNVNALTLFLLGIGVLVLVLGPCLGLYGFGPGLVGMVISWVLAIPLRLWLTGLFKHRDF